MWWAAELLRGRSTQSLLENASRSRGGVGRVKKGKHKGEEKEERV